MAYRVSATHPHDSSAFTQGLAWLGDEALLESTGLYGKSSLRRVRLESGLATQTRALDAAYFGEGIAVIGPLVYQLTWQSELALVWALDDFAPVRTIRYSGEGWGLCRYGDMLLKSDGSNRLEVLDPRSLACERVIRVSDSGKTLHFLNDLEVVRGWILANIWGLDRIAVIDPNSGFVEQWLDVSGLAPAASSDGQNVLNGLAYDPRADVLYVTGKLWPNLYALRVTW